jgi:hypothetical protein
MSVITMHVCDVCGVTLHKGTRYIGVILRDEKVDQGYWSSEEQRHAELCVGCLGEVNIEKLLVKLFPQRLPAQHKGEE